MNTNGWVILQVAADARQVMDEGDPARAGTGDPQPSQLVRGADSRAKQDQRRAVCARSENDPVGGNMG
ncbi:MAG: hypothetical protein K0S99_3813 [Thermomicrobiales bacterium]|nr:hypothetical protein [Thermomicrobiales bacterium]